MLSFLTQCPHCLTSFRVTGRQLDAAEGLVRCGACLGIFSAEANRITVKPTPDEAAAAEARADFDDDEDMDAGFDDESRAHDDFDDAEEAVELEEYAVQADQDEQHEEDEIDDAGELDSTNEDDEPDDADEIELTDGEYDRAASPPHPDRAFATNDADIFGPGDFDIPLGDLNLDIDDDDANEMGEEDFAESGEVESGDVSYGESEEEEEEEEEPSEHEEFDALDLEEAGELDDIEPDDTEEETPANARLIDIVYEEYTDEEADDADSALIEDIEPSEEFEPEFSFDDDELVESRVTAVVTVDEITDDDEPDEYEPDEYEPDEYELDELEDDDEDDTHFEAPPLVPPGTAGPHRSADKAQLHSYLADIEDDDALDPLEDDEALDAFDEPVLLEAAPRRNRFVSLALLLASVALVLLLVWQYADAHIDRLSRSASFAPLMPYACRVLDCPAPQRVQPDLFVSEQLLVRSHPRYAQALEVSLVFRNDAAQAQPFPALELGFRDTSNRMVANRLFQPAEYLPPELQTSEMPPQSSFQVTLELVDPGSDAVNYTLAFRAP